MHSVCQLLLNDSLNIPRPIPSFSMLQAERIGLEMRLLEQYLFFIHNNKSCNNELFVVLTKHRWAWHHGGRRQSEDPPAAYHHEGWPHSLESHLSRQTCTLPLDCQAEALQRDLPTGSPPQQQQTARSPDATNPKHQHLWEIPACSHPPKKTCHFHQRDKSTGKVATTGQSGRQSEQIKSQFTQSPVLHGAYEFGQPR